MACTPATTTPMPTTQALITAMPTTPMLITPIGTMPIEMMPRGATPTAIRLGLSTALGRGSSWPQWECEEPWAPPCLAQGIH